MVEYILSHTKGILNFLHIFLRSIVTMFACQNPSYSPLFTTMESYLLFVNSVCMTLIFDKLQNYLILVLFIYAIVAGNYLGLK